MHWVRDVCNVGEWRRGHRVYAYRSKGSACSLSELGEWCLLLGLTHLRTPRLPCAPRESVCGGCLRTRTGGNKLCCAPAQSMWIEQGSEYQSRDRKRPPRGQSSDFGARNTWIWVSDPGSPLLPSVHTALLHPLRPPRSRPQPHSPLSSRTGSPRAAIFSLCLQTHRKWRHRAAVEGRGLPGPGRATACQYRESRSGGLGSARGYLGARPSRLVLPGTFRGPEGSQHPDLGRWKKRLSRLLHPAADSSLILDKSGFLCRLDP